MSDYLTGAGHFGVGFVAGFSVFLALWLIFKKTLWIRLYGPFIPFALGVLAAVPYFFTYQLDCHQPLWSYAFFFYPLFHCQPFVLMLFGNLHAVVVVCGLLYVSILWYYIRLVKSARRGNLDVQKTKKRRRRA